jgi:alpha-L-fucosidase
LLLGLGCGQDVLVGNLQLRSLSDAGAEIAEAAEADAGVNPQAAAAEGARRDAEQRSLSHDHTGDKSH